jgi:hypothetical protein
MQIKQFHPEYSDKLPQWVTSRDVHEGEEEVKSKGQAYLPATSGMINEGMNSNDTGLKMYEAYKMRAVFPDYFADAVEMLAGLVHQSEASIELPARMEYLRDNATKHGESLNDILRRITVEQLITGRIGVGADLTSGSESRFYLSLYDAESIINWSCEPLEDGGQLNMVTLDESDEKIQADFSWTYEEHYLVLRNFAMEEGGTVSYHVGHFQGGNDGYTDAEMMQISYRGKAIDDIPFVFINTKDLLPEVDSVPLYGLGRLCLAIYRGEADYRQSLFMQSQDTLVVKNSSNPDEQVKTGAGAVIHVDAEGDAKYIGVSSTGLREQREALQNDRKLAQNKAGQLISTDGGQQESGEALRTRLSAQTASLNQIAMTGAKGVQVILRKIARWMGLDETEVVVSPNMEFADVQITGSELVAFMNARQMGAPLSLRSIHNMMKERSITKMDYDTEMERLLEEAANGGLSFEPNVFDNVDADEDEEDEEDGDE